MRKPTMRRCLGSLLTFVLTLPLIPTLAGAQPRLPPALEARLQQIYVQREYATKPAGPGHWLERSGRYTQFEPTKDGTGHDLVQYDPATGERELIFSTTQLKTHDSSKSLTIDPTAFSPDTVFALTRDETQVLLATNAHISADNTTVADLWLFERHSSALKQVATDLEEPDIWNLSSPDGTRIAFARAHNLYVKDLRSGTETQLTTDGVVGTIGNGINDWGSSFIRWSPDGTRIAYTRSDSSHVGLFPLLDNTKDVYPKPHLIRFPKVGTSLPANRLGVIDATGGATRWIKLPPDPTDPANPEGFYLESVEWAGNSNELVVQKLARSKDTYDVILAAARTGATNIVHHEADSAWVKDSGFARNPGFEWIRKGKAFTWLSEKTGWRQAYTVTRDGDPQTALTPDATDVIYLVKVDEKGGWLYYVASPEKATQRYLYRVRLDGTGRAERLTPANQPGTHNYDASLDGRWAVHTYSTADSPPVTELINLAQHRTVHVLEDNAGLRHKLASWGTRPTEFMQLDIGGGIVMDAWMLKPRDFDPTKKYPVFIFIYGEPASTTVVDSWSIGQNKQLFHRALADAGYLVVSMDNRGTPAPKGSAWRRAVFGSLGPLSTEEQAAGLKELARTRPYVDSSRVGLWGWSAGGTNTLNALFRKPDQYHVGISVAPKPRPDLYNAWFQETYMRTPAVNPEGYKLAAPLNYAEGLKGDLLIIHGTGDDNSHLQITELLVDRLVELGKPFDYFTYPNRSHSINEGPGTTSHLYMQMARYLTQHLPAGPLR